MESGICWFEAFSFPDFAWLHPGFSKAAPNVNYRRFVLTNAITMNLRFPGQYYDQESGFHYNYFRDYDPEVGRYVERDPIGLKGGSNIYAYATLNPLIYTDKFGLCRCRATENNKTGSKDHKVFMYWGSFGRTDTVICNYECQASDSAPPDIIRAKHIENYYFWHTRESDDGREGVCLGTVFFDNPVFDPNRLRVIYSAKGFGSFDPRRSDERGFKSPDLEDWAKRNCNCEK